MPDNVSLFTPELAAATAAELVGQDMNLGARVHRDVEADFGQGSGATVHVRVPGATTVNTRGVYSTDPLVNGSINEQTIPVVLDVEAYSSVPLSRGTSDLDITSYAQQILAPQTSALVDYAEDRVATAMAATPLTVTIAYDDTDPAKAIGAARATLRANGVNDSTPIMAAVGVDIWSALQDAPPTIRTFDADGKVRGVEVFETSRIPADEIVVFIKNAFALVVRGPQKPDGVDFAASVKSEDGSYALSLVRVFDGHIGAEKSILAAFVGCRAMPLAVRDTDTGTVSLQEHGGVVRLKA